MPDPTKLMPDPTELMPDPTELMPDPTELARRAGCAIRRPEGFGPGYTPITRRDEVEANTGIDFGILKLEDGRSYAPNASLETAYLLLDGGVVFSWDGERRPARRTSLFDEDPTCLHLPAGEASSVSAVGAAELAVFQTENARSFPPLLFDGATMLGSEQRGKGKWGDTACRIVRTIFDVRNRPDAELVLGEVVNLPGRWSSYPPHHHPQPEIYHYRFTREQGYGHGELGDEVLKIRHNDTLKILDAKDHAQVAAPGYGMYYIWVIRHLPGHKYEEPEFNEQHAWLNADQPAVWSYQPGE